MLVLETTTFKSPINTACRREVTCILYADSCIIFDDLPSTRLKSCYYLKGHLARCTIAHFYIYSTKTLTVLGIFGVLLSVQASAFILLLIILNFFAVLVFTCTLPFRASGPLALYKPISFDDLGPRLRSLCHFQFIQSVSRTG